MGRAQRKSKEPERSGRRARAEDATAHAAILDERGVLERLEDQYSLTHEGDPIVGIRNAALLGAGVWLLILAAVYVLY